MTVDIPALIAPLPIEWGGITSADSAGGKCRQAIKVPMTTLEELVAVDADDPGRELRNVGTMPAACHVIDWTSAGTRRFGRAAQGTAR